jgi:hypothetical protein
MTLLSSVSHRLKSFSVATQELSKAYAKQLFARRRERIAFLVSLTNVRILSRFLRDA